MGKDTHYMVESYTKWAFPRTYYNEYSEKALKLWGVNPIEMNIPPECLLHCVSGKLLTLNEATKIIEDFMAEK